jgi:glycosyltransferase involved in cell wall biosynthesis
MYSLSIITVNFNNKSGLQKTLDSVTSQTYTNFEFIIIDGGSIDGSKEIIEENQSNISYWVSEKDRGIYHAMNKGIKKSTGEHLLFLNSGDYFCDSLVLSKVFANELIHDIVYGDIIWDTNGVQAVHQFPDSLSFKYFAAQHILPHQGSFIRSSLFKSIGLYDETQKIIADWIFFLVAICKYNCSYKHIGILISVCGRDGISCDPVNLNSIISSKTRELQKHFPAFVDDYKYLQSLKLELEEIKGMLGFRLHRKLRKLTGH